MFCQHSGPYYQKEEAFWSLLNPEQTLYIKLDNVEIFLEKL